MPVCSGCDTTSATLEVGKFGLIRTCLNLYNINASVQQIHVVVTLCSHCNHGLKQQVAVAGERVLQVPRNCLQHLGATKLV